MSLARKLFPDAGPDDHWPQAPFKVRYKGKIRRTMRFLMEEHLGVELNNHHRIEQVCSEPGCSNPSHHTVKAMRNNRTGDLEPLPVPPSQLHHRSVPKTKRTIAKLIRSLDWWWTYDQEDLAYYLNLPIGVIAEVRPRLREPQ